MAGPGLPVPPRSKPLRFRHSGSPLRRRLGWACILCSSQVQAAQVMRCLASANAATYHLPATRLSGCKTSTPSQADVDRPDPQEVLVSSLKQHSIMMYPREPTKSRFLSRSLEAFFLGLEGIIFTCLLFVDLE